MCESRFRKRIPPQRGERKLARGERSEPLGRREQRYAPRQGLQELPAPLPGRISLLQYSGGSLCSPPAKLPAPFQGACAYLKKGRWRIYGIMYLVTRTFDCTPKVSQR